MVREGDYGYQQVNVASQRDNPDSFLSWVKYLISTRRTCPECGWGSCEVIGTDRPNVLAHRCKYQRDAVIAVHNLSDEPCTVTLQLEQEEQRLQRVLGNAEAEESTGRGPRHIELQAYGYGWYRVRGT